MARALLGGALMPWQRYVADVAMELDVNNPGAYQYQTVVVTVPRQAGKSHLSRAVMIDRLLSYNDHTIVMTAQTGKDARKSWKKMVKALGADRKENESYFHALQGQGSEVLEYLPRESTVSPFAPTPKSVHGDTVHLAHIDEAWAFDEIAGEALKVAINPTQLTVLDSQLWIVSTRGTGRSAYLNKLIDEGRASVDDPNSRIAYFEWSADEVAADKDPYGRETLAFHPAIGHTQTYEKILALGQSENLGSWRRSYLNLPAMNERDSLIDLGIWAGLTADPRPEMPAFDKVTFAWDVAADGGAASLAAAWPVTTPDGTVIYGEIMKVTPGTNWVIPALAKLHASGSTRFYSDDSGPNRTLNQAVSDAGISFETLTSRDYATACQMIFDKAKKGNIMHNGSDSVVRDLQAVAIRSIGGTMAFSIEKSDGPIQSLRALAIAMWAAATKKEIGVQAW
ncbi:hypothetical protein BM477_04785 [Boudabousia marimammalium]|uniref:Terminase n=1 Tax=Boudabousia marimammalium TaxID=156892 RepID=A0A1Q5PPC8_9ACTO|nr:hypothetical protein BM477_04785 [Boudabousia marimammalium]